MKRLYLILLLFVVTLSASAQTIGEAFYVYRNDGQFNAFFRDEVDSIAYSHYDVDSVYYDENVTQLVYTADSLYRIPLAAIDSVAFVQPENVLKPHVMSLAGSILDYLVKYEGVCLYFLETIPSDILPRVGDKLVTIEMTEMFPVGFFGEVIAVKKEDGFVVVEFSGLELEDVFDSYSYSVNLVSEDENASRALRADKDIDRVISIPTMSHSWSLGFGYSMFNVKNTVEASLFPKFHIKGNDLVDPKRGRLTDIRITGTYVTGVKYEFGFEVAPDPLDFPFPGGRGEYPICPALSFFWDFGMFVGVSGSVTYSQQFTQEYISHIDYKREGIKMPTIDFGQPSMVGGQKSVPRIALKGSVRGGFYGELGIKPWGLDKNNPLGKVSGRLEIGVEAEMEHGIDLGGLENADKSTALYDFVDNANDFTNPTFTISPYASVTITVKVGPWNSHWVPWKGKIGSPFYQGGFFPHFSNTGYERTDSGIKFSSDLSRTCPFPWEIGFSVFDLNGNFVKTEYFGRSYSEPRLFDTYDVTISGLSKDAEYKVYPCINVFNHPVLASPFVMVRSCPVKLSDFKVTKKQHEEGAFTNDGLTYDYRFDVSVTATLNNSENVHDWGYVYRDPNGREKKISLVQPSNYGTTYTDTRWAYFRNGTPPFTCTLVPYVEYVGSDEPVYGEPQDFPLEYGETTCPDSNHPHWIDLGIGTQWRCCNAGASSPEDYGGYYTFDQAQAYNPPSREQIKALVENCSYTWTTQNGVKGGKFTGPNGGTIFLPAAGCRLNGVFYNVGSWGVYWSSTPPDEDIACVLDFDSYYADWYNTIRFYELSVRPVR